MLTSPNAIDPVQSERGARARAMTGRSPHRRIRKRTDAGSAAVWKARPDVTPATSVIGPEALDVLLSALADRGYRVLGPTVRDGAIVYDDLDSAADLPIGW